MAELILGFIAGVVVCLIAVVAFFYRIIREILKVAKLAHCAVDTPGVTTTTGPRPEWHKTETN